MLFQKLLLACQDSDGCSVHLEFYWERCRKDGNAENEGTALNFGYLILFCKLLFLTLE